MAQRSRPTSLQASQSTTVATSSGRYPSWVGECWPAVDAANYAKSYPGNPTKFYAMSAYRSPATSSDVTWRNADGYCVSDRTSGVSHPYITPCQTMQAMASSPSTFFSDYYLPGE